MCLVKNFPFFRNKLTVYVLFIVIASAGLVEKQHRADDLFVFMFPWMIEAIIEHINSNFQLKDKKLLNGVQNIGMASMVALLT